MAGDEVLGGGLSTGGSGATSGGQKISILDHATQHPEAHRVAHGPHGMMHKNHKSKAQSRPNQKNPLADTMKNLMNMPNILGGIIKMLQSGTALQNLGNLGNILGQVSQQLGIQGGNLNNLLQALPNLNNLPNTNQMMQQLVEAVGPAGALGLAMLGSTDVDLSNIAGAITGNYQPSQDQATLPFYNPLSTAPPQAAQPSVDTPAGTLPAIDAVPSGPLHTGQPAPPVGDQKIDPPVTETTYAGG